MLDKIRRNLVKAAKWALQKPADALILSSRVLPRRVNDCLSTSSAFMENASLSAQFYPQHREARSFVVSPPPSSAPTAALPIPPPELWEGYADTVEEYLQSGVEHWQSMSHIVARAGFDFTGKRILDFGCSAGRLIRHFKDFAQTGEIRGVDISATHITWAQQHLSPPFHFTTTTTHPHLPFEDRYFDFIYSGSVFTHISDLAGSWLLELKRILKPGGLLYITVHDGQCIEVLEKKYPAFFLTRILSDFDKKTHFRSSPYEMVSLVARSPKDAMVFYDREYLKRTWGREFRVLSVTSEAYGYQSAFLLQKPL